MNHWISVGVTDVDTTRQDEWRSPVSGKRTQADRDFDLSSGREIERKDAEIDRLRAKLRKMIAWLDRLATRAETEAKTCRFETLREAYVADAKNYRATIKDILTVLPTDTGSMTPDRQHDDGDDAR